MSCMYNFFCGMQFIVGMADQYRGFLTQSLKPLTRCQALPLSIHLQNLLKWPALGLLELTVTHLKKRGNQIQTLLSIFLRQKGIQRVLLLHYKDNKFFIDGGRVFFIIPDIIELVTKQLGGSYLVICKSYHAGYKALGT